MAFQHELRRGVTASEATLVITDLGNQYDFLSTYRDEVFKDRAVDATMDEADGIIPQPITTSNVKAMVIEKALLDEVKIACEHLRARHNKADIPNDSTAIKLLFESTFDNFIDSIEMTKKSIAIWLQGFEPDKSILFDPTESYLLEGKSEINSANESTAYNDDMDNYLSLALQVYEHCWKGLPAGMKNPSKDQIEKYIIDVIGIYNLKGIEKKYVPKLIDSIIKVSAPKNHNFGSPQSSKLEIWKELFNRKGLNQKS